MPVLKRMPQADDIARTVSFIVETPLHVAINQITISPTWNGAYGAPAIVEEVKS